MQAVAHPGRHRPRRPAAERGRRSWTAWTPAGCSTPGPTAAIPPRLARVRRRGPAPARHPAPVRHPAGPARPGPGRPRHPGRRRRLVLHPGRHPRTVRRRGPGHGPDRAGRPRRHRPRQRAAGDAAGRRRLLRRVPAGCRCPTCTSGAGPWASACRSRAQSWQGLGATEDERYRIAATADGGIFVMHTPYPEPLVAAGRDPAGAGDRAQADRRTPGAMRAPPASSAPGPPTRT